MKKKKKEIIFGSFKALLFEEIDSGYEMLGG
jgi:hypothetical protein